MSDWSAAQPAGAMAVSLFSVTRNRYSSSGIRRFIFICNTQIVCVCVFTDIFERVIEKDFDLLVHSSMWLRWLGQGQALEFHLPLLSQEHHQQGTTSEVEQPGFEPALLWDVSLIGGSPTCCTNAGTTMKPWSSFWARRHTAPTGLCPTKDRAQLCSNSPE